MEEIIQHIIALVIASIGLLVAIVSFILLVFFSIRSVTTKELTDSSVFYFGIAATSFIVWVVSTMLVCITVYESLPPVLTYYLGYK